MVTIVLLHFTNKILSAIYKYTIEKLAVLLMKSENGYVYSFRNSLEVETAPCLNCSLSPLDPLLTELRKTPKFQQHLGTKYLNDQQLLLPRTDKYFRGKKPSNGTFGKRSKSSIDLLETGDTDSIRRHLNTQNQLVANLSTLTKFRTRSAKGQRTDMHLNQINNFVDVFTPTKPKRIFNPNSKMLSSSPSQYTTTPYSTRSAQSLHQYKSAGASNSRVTGSGSRLNSAASTSRPGKNQNLEDIYNEKLRWKLLARVQQRNHIKLTSQAFSRRAVPNTTVTLQQLTIPRTSRLGSSPGDFQNTFQSNLNNSSKKLAANKEYSRGLLLHKRLKNDRLKQLNDGL